MSNNQSWSQGNNESTQKNEERESKYQHDENWGDLPAHACNLMHNIRKLKINCRSWSKTCQNSGFNEVNVQENLFLA